jgi:hypothetical protein
VSEPEYRDPDYGRWVDLVAAALHQDCLLDWQAIRVVDPGRGVTQHGIDAHWGRAHDLVRRLHLDRYPADVGDPERQGGVTSGNDQAPDWPSLTDRQVVEYVSEALSKVDRELTVLSAEVATAKRRLRLRIGSGRCQSAGKE